MKLTPFASAVAVLLSFCVRPLPAAPGADGVTRNVLLPPEPGNPRNSEGDFIRLKDGTVLFVYTHFTGGAEDNSKARLVSRSSSDGGLTWTEGDAPVPTAAAKENVMSVSLLRLATGEIGLFYLVKNSFADCRLYMQTSDDEAKSWGEPRLCIPDEGYFVVNNDRVVQTKAGRLVVPAALHTNSQMKFHARATALCYLSDDGGKTWRAGRDSLEAPAASRSGLQEPGVVELKDGRLLMLCRTDQGSQFRSHSDDGGETWSPAEPSDILSPLSPASIERIPSTGDLLLVWNDHRDVDAAHKGKRTPLTVAVSADDGKTWSGVRNIETDPDGWYCYTAIDFVGERVLLGHCAGRPDNRLGTTQITSFPVEWLYEKR